MNQKEKKYLDYISEHCRSMNFDDVEFDFKSGSHNDVVIINKENVFKFAKYDWSAIYLMNSVKAINLVKYYTDLTLPDIKALDPGVAICSYIKGCPLYRNELLLRKNLDQEILAQQIGTFLKQLHLVPLKKAAENGIENKFADINSDYWKSKYEEFQNKLFPYCDDYTKKYIHKLFQPVFERKDFFNYTPSLIHADLNPRHFFLDSESSKINSILGFSRSGIGDPAFDTGTLIAYLGESFVARVSEYDNNILEQIDRARFYAYLIHLNMAKDLADRIATRDFSNFRIDLGMSDIMPIGKHLI
jgi:aminoglycoside 2''-phosphotransferase